MSSQDVQDEEKAEMMPLQEMKSSNDTSLSDLPPPTGSMADHLDKIAEDTKSNSSDGGNSRFKDNLSFVLSVFNLMNAILGSGILGLAETLKNVGVIPFIVLMGCTGLLGSYTINMLLHMSQLAGVTSYEKLSERALGKFGKIFTTIVILIHCLGALCSYLFIIKSEVPEFMKAVSGHEGSDFSEWYYNEVYLLLLIVAIVILPLATMKNIKFLGYSSGFAMACMLFFTITVIVKKFQIPCPIPSNNLVVEATHPPMYVDNITYMDTTTQIAATTFMNATTEMDATSTQMGATTPAISNAHEAAALEEGQTCKAKMFNFSIKSAYSLPTMFFSFMCHASMLSIYAELRSPSIKRMQKVANVSISLVLVVYISAALFGYLTFYSGVKSELLLTYSQFDAHDPLVIVARCMVIICVTLSFPLLHFPARKTIILTFCKRPNEFIWVRHIIIMIAFISISVLLVVFIPDIRDIFGFAGATTSTMLLVILPSVFVVRLTGQKALPQVQNLYRNRRMMAYGLGVFGMCFMCTSLGMLIANHVVSSPESH